MKRQMIGTVALLSVLAAGSALAQGSTPPAAAPAAPAKQEAPAKTTEKKAAPAKSARHANWTADQIKSAQDALTKGGYYKGKSTGKWNKATSAALKAWQKANKMPASGRLSDEVLQKLTSGM